MLAGMRSPMRSPIKPRATALLGAGLLTATIAAGLSAADPPNAERINKAVSLLSKKQPIYYFTEGRGGSQGGFKEGLRLAQTWADLIIYEMEFGAYDVTELREFMAGLVQGGPTPSGHRTPAVQVVLPFSGYDVATVRANHWVVQQVLAAGRARRDSVSCARSRRGKGVCANGAISAPPPGCRRRSARRGLSRERRSRPRVAGLGPLA